MATCPNPISAPLAPLERIEGEAPTPSKLRGGLWQVLAATLPDRDAWSAFQPPAIGRRVWWTALASLWGFQLVLLLLTWGRWPDVIIDFGRELYIPWQMAEGQVLYRDLAYFNGPLTPLVHAALFTGFGADFRVLIVANTLVLGWIVALLYANLTRLFSLRTTLAAVVVFLLLFAYGHTYGIGNFNFLAPYSHEMTHGFALCLTLLTVLSSARTECGRGMVAGACCGAIVLTKPEMAVAAALLVATSLGTRYLARQQTLASLLREIALLGLAALATILLVVGGLAVHQGDWSRCWTDSLGAWRWLLSSRVSELTFYRSISGLDAPWLHLLRAVSGLCGFVLLLVATRLFAAGSPRQRRLLLVAGLLGFALLVWHAPLLLKNMQVGGILLLLWLFAAPRTVVRQHFAAWHLVVCWTVLGLSLLIKMFLYPRIDGYGFTLAALLVVLGIAVALEWIPRMYYAASHRNLIRAGLIGFLAVDVLVLGAISQIRLSSKSFEIGPGAQGLHSYPCIGPVVRDAIVYLQTKVRPDETVLVLPEGVMLNYLSGRRSPTRFYNFMPPELEMFGAQEILKDLVHSRPDVVVLVRRVVYEYGHERFGPGGYGADILDWVQANYAVEQTIGADPLGDGDFGIAILRPDAAAAAR